MSQIEFLKASYVVLIELRAFEFKWEVIDVASLEFEALKVGEVRRVHDVEEAFKPNAILAHIKHLELREDEARGDASYVISPDSSVPQREFLKVIPP
jgi:hypothetical protein